MAASLVARYWITKPEANLQSYDLRVEIQTATDMPKEVLVMHRGVAPALRPDDDLTDLFQCVADPVDLEEFPTTAPDLTNEMPYYRVDDITLRFRSMGELEDVRKWIDADLKDLVTSLKAGDSLTSYEVVTHA
jgi:hypothetical protein